MHYRNNHKRKAPDPITALFDAGFDALERFINRQVNAVMPRVARFLKKVRTQR